jgi:hypothetical protein
MGWNHYDGPDQPPIPIGPSAAVTQVQTVMSNLQSAMQGFNAQASSILSALQSLTVPDVGQLPDISITRSNTGLEWPAPTPVDITGMNDLSASVPDDPGVPDINTTVTINPPTYNPSIVSINVPTAPGAIDTSGLPDRPAVDTNVTLPAAPSLAFPALASLSDVTIPTFVFPTLGTFTDAAPTFDAAAPNALINWVEPTYASENFDLVKQKIADMLNAATSTGLPAVIEQQLFDRARAREDITANKAVAEAFDTFANRGFTAPPGMLTAQVNAALEQNQLQANALQREWMVKIADVEIENLREAVRQGIAAENIIFNIFNNAATRSYEIAKFTVQAQIELYQAQVSVFNALTSAYNTRAQVFKIQIDAQLAALDAYRIELEGQKLVSEINTQKVQQYNAQVQSLLAQVEVYKAQMQGAQIQTEVARTQIEAYRTDVQAYAEKISAQKVVFDAYIAQVQGEVAKVGIVDAEARTFATLMSAEQMKADIQLKGIDAQIAQMQAVTQRFAAQLDRTKTELQAKLAQIQAQAQVQGLNIQYLGVQSDANAKKAEAEIRIGEQQLQTNIAITNTQIERFKVSMEKVLQEAQLKTSALQSAGQIAATLGAGAMAAQHVQASISASSGDSTSVSYGFSQSAAEQWQYQPTSDSQ